MHKYDDELFKSSGAADMDWNPEEMLEQASSLFAHFVPNSSFGSNLDELASIMSCKMTSSAPIPAPGSTLDTLPESIWDKFDLLNYVLDDCPASPLDDLEEEVAQVATPIVVTGADVRLSCSLESNPSPINEMRHHDCMWAGLCRHEEHGDADLMVTPPSSPTGFPDTCPKSPTASQIKPIVSRPVNSRSLLMPRKDVASKFASKLSYQDIVGHRPETPVSDFDESFQSMHATYSANEDEDSETDSIQSSSETEMDDCMDEATPMVDSRYVNHGTSYITDHTYGRPAPYRQPDTNNYGLCTPSDSEEEIDVVSLQPSKTPESSTRLLQQEVVEPQKQLLLMRTPTKRSKLTPTKRSARQSARAARASTLSSKRNSQSHDFQEELHQSLAAMAAEAAKEVVPPLRLRLQQHQHQHGGKRRKMSMATPPTSSSGSSSCSSSSEEDAAPAPKRGVKRSRMSKKINQAAAASRKRSAQAAALNAARSSSDSDERSGKRTMHNTMERQRRVDLRNAFETLRQYVPPLLNSEKAPKVTILREASNYCVELQEMEQDLESQRDALLKHQVALRQRLSQMRKTQANARR